ncbi:MAG TPA: UrcA family protein, partial [Steroidobacteraceae bacterium]|jgi:UrcA family protein
MNLTQTTIRAATFFLAGAITLCALEAAARASDAGLPTRTVSYADLDISSPAGAKILYRRIESAANQVCEYGAYWEMSLRQKQHECIDRVIDKAVKDVDSPALSALRPTSVTHLASN